MVSVFKMPVGRNDIGRRLDKILRIVLKDMPISAIHKALRKGDIRVGGARQPPEYRCREGDIIEFSHVIQVPGGSPEIGGIERLPKNLPILLETADLLFLNKSMGVLVHDGPDSLDALVRAYLAGKLETSLAFTPGPLHRLDRNTSGIIAFSRSIAGARVFGEELRKGAIHKIYIALLEGELKSRSTWKENIERDFALRKSFIRGESEPDGAFIQPSAAKPSAEGEPREAITEVFPLGYKNGLTLAALRLGTGRTHQIRVQAAFHGYPLLGDSKYGGKRSEQPYYLHAWELRFENKPFPDVPLSLSAPLPIYFVKKIESCFSMNEKEVCSSLRQFRF